MKESSNTSRVIRSLLEVIDSTNPEEQRIITDLWRAVELFKAIEYLEEKRDNL
jgi:hypothetical protein